MQLRDVHQGIHKNKRKKRIGRGPGSKRGRTATRGNKGQYARSGDDPTMLKEGGQMPLFRRLPKRGFNNAEFRVMFNPVNLSRLDTFDAGATIDPELLKEKGIARRSIPFVKVLGDGEVTKKLEVHAHAFSKSAKEKIEQAGGSCVLVPMPAHGPKVRNKMRPKRNARQS